MVRQIQFFHARLEEFRVHTVRHTRWNRHILTGISIKGETYDMSREFWQSLLICFHIAPKTSNFIEDAALFQLLQEASPKRWLRCEVSVEADGQRRLIRAGQPPGDARLGKGAFRDGRRLATVN